MAYQLTMASYQKWDRDRELAQNRPLRRYLESKVPTDEKIKALEAALASLKAEVREESVRRSGSHLLELMDRLEPVGALVQRTSVNSPRS